MWGTWPQRKGIGSCCWMSTFNWTASPICCPQIKLLHFRPLPHAGDPLWEPRPCRPSPWLPWAPPTHQLSLPGPQAPPCSRSPAGGNPTHSARPPGGIRSSTCPAAKRPHVNSLSCASGADDCRRKRGRGDYWQRWQPGRSCGSKFAGRGGIAGDPRAPFVMLNSIFWM